jgi:hypothetical protein
MPPIAYKRHQRAHLDLKFQRPLTEGAGLNAGAHLDDTRATVQSHKFWDDFRSNFSPI